MSPAAAPGGFLRTASGRSANDLAQPVLLAHRRALGSGGAPMIADTRIAEAQARADGAINLTSGDVHHAAVFNRLEGAGCEWPDILAAIDKTAATFRAKGRLFRSWVIIEEHALAMRDLRLKPLPEPSNGQRNSTPADTQRNAWNRLLAEVEGAGEGGPRLAL